MGPAQAPIDWPWALSPPLVSSEATGWRGTPIARWSGTAATMVQPPLDHHYVVMHLGGDKHVERRKDGPGASCLAEHGSITLVPAGTAYTWRTVGPIAFAHLYLAPAGLDSFVDREFDVEGRGTSLQECVGRRDPPLERLFAALLAEIEFAGHASALRLDTLLECLVARLANRHASSPAAGRFRAVALAPYAAQRVLDFVEANLSTNLRLADLAAAAGTSASHFSHAFRETTGQSPYGYLIRRRVEQGKYLLLTSVEPLATIGATCGFRSQHQFALMFKRLVGVGPKRFRSERGSGLSHGARTPLQ
ncbi:MAG: AraC family transcriptional regulator [Caldimonas sp.]